MFINFLTVTIKTIITCLNFVVFNAWYTVVVGLIISFLPNIYLEASSVEGTPIIITYSNEIGNAILVGYAVIIAILAGIGMSLITLLRRLKPTCNITLTART